MRNLPTDLKRARYFRGHGVHSPFVYAIVRQVFMRSAPIDGDTALYTALKSRGISERRAVQLQNLMIHCGYTSFGIDCADDDKACRAIIAKHRCTDIDNRGYLLLFNNYLPKQSFRL